MKYIPIPDGSHWPAPDVEEDSIEWQLRYGDAQKVRLQAASYISAYNYLISCTRKKRELVVRSLRKALSEGRDDE